MENLVLLIPLGIFALVFFLRRGGGFKRPEVSPLPDEQLKFFEAAPSLFVNAAEAALFAILRDKLPGQFHLHSKVRLEDIIRVKRNVNPKLRWAMRGRVKSRHVDYLITTREGRMILAIELDGSSHNPKNPSEADKVKTALFQAASLPYGELRWEKIFTTLPPQLHPNCRWNRNKVKTFLTLFVLSAAIFRGQHLQVLLVFKFNKKKKIKKISHEIVETDARLALLKVELAAQMVRLAEQTEDVAPLKQAEEALSSARNYYTFESTPLEVGLVQVALGDSLYRFGRAKADKSVLNRARDAYRAGITLASMHGDDRQREALRGKVKLVESLINNPPKTPSLFRVA